MLQQLQVFTFFPESLPAAKKPFERKTMDRQSARRSFQGQVRWKHSIATAGMGMGMGTHTYTHTYNLDSDLMFPVCP